MTSGLLGHRADGLDHADDADHHGTHEAGTPGGGLPHSYPAAVDLTDTTVTPPAPLEDDAPTAAVIDPGVPLAGIPGGTIGAAYGDTFKLHSLPTSNYKVFLDFDGHTTTGTSWNSYWGVGSFYSPAFSMDGSESFTTAELTAVQQIWQRLAEYFAPFNIDVTTEDPGVAGLTYSGAGDTAYGIRLVITDEGGKPWGGLAYNGSFDWNSDTAAFVYANPLGDNVHSISVAAAHEVGHSLGLDHDGQGGSEYYYGHTGWAPVMGVGYSAGVVQWSNGGYTGATNLQDDLTIITTQNGGVTYRADDYGNSIATAASLGGTVANGVATVSKYGLITGSGSRNDVDAFSFTVAAGGSVNLTVSAATRGFVTGSATPLESASPFSMLDVRLTLLNASGAQVAVFDDATRQDGVISASNLAAGTYYLTVDGTGWGTPLAASPTGWSEYGSLGQYRVSGTYTVTAVADVTPPAAPVIAAVTDDLAPVTGNVASGGATNDTSLTLSGSAEAGSTVTIRDGATVLGSAVANGSGGWSFTTGVLAQGGRSFTATATDAAGNVSVASTAYAVTIDTTVPLAPAITAVTDNLAPVTGNVANGGRSNDPTLTLSGTAEANSTVTLRDGATVLGTAV
ncbi:MAG: pre-peptidase C-terminal domain-containing protein, partial [Acetobacteraceae bacterium]|nr:pre-peptidase C-terminal domain-containing protein [Acetobacteraceae bacterium]